MAAALPSLPEEPPEWCMWFGDASLAWDTSQVNTEENQAWAAVKDILVSSMKTETSLLTPALPAGLT